MDGMHFPTPEQIDAAKRTDRAAIESLQVTRLNQLLGAILPGNPLYHHKLSGVVANGVPKVESLAQFAEWPISTKADLLAADSADHLPTNLTFPLEQYVRYHQTSGTRGRPMQVFDTADDWRWWIGCWQYVLQAANITSEDRVMMAFSFGPFIGFWSADDACAARARWSSPVAD